MAKWEVIGGGYVFFDKANRPHMGGAIIDDQDPMNDTKGQMHKLEPVAEPKPEPKPEPKAGPKEAAKTEEKPEEVKRAEPKPTDRVPDGPKPNADQQPGESRSL